MEFNLNDFQPIVRSVGQNLLPKGTLRVNTKSIVLSADVAARFYNQEFKTRVYISLAFSEEHNAFMLSRENKDNFAFVISDPKTGTARLQPLPRAVQALKVPKGLYKQHPDNEDVFVYDKFEVEAGGELLDAKAKYLVEDFEPEVGDIVSWVVKPRDNIGTRIYTGQVQKVYERKLDTTSEKVCSIFPFSKAWYDDHHPSKSNRVARASIKANKLILREKHNV